LWVFAFLTVSYLSAAALMPPRFLATGAVEALAARPVVGPWLAWTGAAGAWRWGQGAGLAPREEMDCQAWAAWRSLQNAIGIVTNHVMAP
jgi:hypothetical protein